MTTDWHAADKAYQAHHSQCNTCRAAGARPGHLQRCSTGQGLWDTYNQAGTPPHLMTQSARKEATP